MGNCCYSCNLTAVGTFRPVSIQSSSRYTMPPIMPTKPSESHKFHYTVVSRSTHTTAVLLVSSVARQP
ncbi:MAG: hypothetical protein LIO74_02190 [Ruminococcus sp.]|nr:hypothetical protein [Ruminococcus sp.]